MKIIIVVSLWTGSLFIVVGSLVKNIYEKARMEGREKLSSPDPNRKDFSQANPLQTGTIYRKVQTRIIQDVSRPNITIKENQRSCSSKNLDWNFLCSAWDEIFGNNFLSFTFAWSRFWLSFWSHSRNNPPPPPPLGQNFDRWIYEWQQERIKGTEKASLIHTLFHR